MMKRRVILVAGAILVMFASRVQVADSQTIISGTADVKRAVLTSEQLLSGKDFSSPLDDVAGFAMPQPATEASPAFEGTLTLETTDRTDHFVLISDIFHIVPAGDSAWKHLPPFSFQLVQSGSYLIPKSQGLALTGSYAWNYIVGPGRVWQEKSDRGYMRASLPFALIQRNQNCVHNGEMTFLFSNSKKPPLSDVYFQITQETCYPMKFDMWGMVKASYAPGEVPAGTEIKKAHESEIRQRMPSKPLDILREDFPNAGFSNSTILAGFKHPENVTTYGFVMNGTNYSAGCPTRYGEYAFCEDMRLPSYSIAKSVFAGVALMRLGQLYGVEVYKDRIKDFIPAQFIRGNWDTTTFNNVSDMATGNYNLDGYEADEDSQAMDQFLIDESYEAKLNSAFALDKNYATPGTKWVYQSSATFILTQAMNEYLKRREGRAADIFNKVRDDVYQPLKVSSGGMTTIRTDNSAAGAPSGYYGLFLIKDDVAKIGSFLNLGDGVIGGQQILERSRLEEALFRSENAAEIGVPILGSNPASTLGAAQSGPGQRPPVDTRRYAHGFWGKLVTPLEFPEFRCSFWVSFMAGYGGNLVVLLPNGVTFYVFSDGYEFRWVDAVRQANELVPICKNNARAAEPDHSSTKQ
jgi:CubicO group peptidase (beta-lactamase class C family)